MILNSPYISGSLTVTGNEVVTGSLTVLGGITGAITGSATSASYAANAELLDGLDSTVFVQTGSFNTFSSSILAYTGSTNTRLNSLEVTTGSLNTASGSAITRLNALEATTGSLNTASGSAITRLGSIESKTGSYATTGSNTFIGTQTISGSIFGSGSLTINGCITSTGTIIAQTINVQTVTSSIVYSSGSNIFGNLLGDSQRFTGSVLITGSLNIEGASSATSYSGATVYGSTTVCSAVGLFSGCVSIGTTTAYTSRLNVQATAANRPAIKAGYGGVTGNGYWILGDNYTTDESLIAIGVDYSGGGLVLGSILAPSTTTQGAFISTQAQFGGYGSAIRLNTSGEILFYNGTQNSVIATGCVKTASIALTIAQTGAATFTNSVQADGSSNGFLINQNSGAAGLATYSANADRAQIAFKYAQNYPASNNYTRVLDIVSTGDGTGGGIIRLFTTVNNSTPSAALTLASTGAATFTAATQDAIQTVVRMAGNNASSQIKGLDFKLTAGTPLWTISTSAVGTDAGINIMPNGSAGLSLAYSTGAATFSSSVTSDDLILTAGTLFGAGNTGFSNRSSDTTLYLQMPATGFNITDNALNTKFILSSAGAATFSSSVTATSFIGEAGSTEIRLRGGGYGGSYNTSLRSIAGGVGVLQFGNNGENHVLIGNTATSANTYLSFRINSTTESTTSGTEAFRITSTGAGNSSTNFYGAATFCCDIITKTRLYVQHPSQSSIWLNQAAGGSSTGFLVGRSYGSADTQDFFIYDIAASSRRLEISSTGEATFINTVCAPGIKSTGTVIGGNFITNSGTASLPYASYATFFTAQNYQNALYLVTLQLNGYSSYTAYAIIAQNDSSLVIMHQVNNNAGIQISGLDIQGTNGSGITQSMVYKIIRIG